MDENADGDLLPGRADFRAKFDSELRDIHTSYLDLQRGNPDRVYPLHTKARSSEPLSLRLQFTGDLAGIEARGFHTEWVEADLARGDVALADLEAVAAHPGVLKLEYGGGFRLLLDHSTVELRARGPSFVWDVTPGGVFSGDRGTGVVIGIIDTGIDIKHPVFHKVGPANAPVATRIKRIWDMGIDPHDGIGSPDVALLQGNQTYGVEYTEQMINDVLRKVAGAKPVKHRDCHGHGTFVASIAAGNGQAQRSRKKFQFVGAAPEADLVIVKFGFLQKEPQVDLERRFEDAVTYVERVAGKLTEPPPPTRPPVVINFSAGWNSGPHDGLETRDRFIENRFVGSTGKALVAAAGNDGGSQQYAEITIPAGGTINVPFTIYDTRLSTTDRARCGVTDNTERELIVEFWYRPPPGGAQLTATLTTPKGTPVTVPALPGTLSGAYPTRRKFLIAHAADTVVRQAGQQVTRNLCGSSSSPAPAASEQASARCA